MPVFELFIHLMYCNLKKRRKKFSARERYCDRGGCGHTHRERARLPLLVCSFSFFYFRLLFLSFSPSSRLFITISRLYFLANIYSIFDVLTLLQLQLMRCAGLYVGCAGVCVCASLMISSEIEEAISQHE